MIQTAFTNIKLYNLPSSPKTYVLSINNSGNALDSITVSEMIMGLNLIRSDGSVKFLIITGSGNVMCSGINNKCVERLLHIPSEELEQYCVKLSSLLHDIASMDIITICRVNGDVHGMGLGIVTACDFVISSLYVNFFPCDAMRGINNSLLYPYLSDRVGKAKAKLMLIEPDKITAQSAHALGLVDTVAAMDLLDAYIIKRIEKINSCIENAPISVKKSINELNESQYGIQRSKYQDLIRSIKEDCGQWVAKFKGMAGNK